MTGRAVAIVLALALDLRAAWTLHRYRRLPVAQAWACRRRDRALVTYIATVEARDRICRRAGVTRTWSRTG